MSWPRSIRWRLQLWHGALLLAVTTALSVAYHRSERAEAEARLDRDLRLILMVALPEVGLAPPTAGGGRSPRAPSVMAADGSLEIRHPLLQQWVDEGGFVVFWDRLDEFTRMGSPPTGIARTWSPGLVEGERGESSRNQARNRILWHERRGGELIGIGRPLTSLVQGSQRLALQLTVAGATVVLIGWLIGAWLIGRALRPLAAISATARRIADGAYHERIGTATASGELAALAEVLNHSFARVEAAFQQQAQFTADASHELRTPITVILSESQLALRRERSAAEYQESLATCEDAARRMKRLVDDLLLLARAEVAGGQAAHAPLDLRDLAHRVTDFLAALAEERGKKLSLDAPTEVPVLGDAEALERVLLNLIMNALQHAPEGDTVTVSVSTSDGWAQVTVTDHGPGLPEAELERIFDRFHRVDEARTRDTGGTGLGLAIARSIAHAHAGTLTATSVPHLATTFTLRLPKGGG